MQLKAASEIKTLEEGRQISLDSYKVINYNHKEKDIWDDSYNRYLEILNEARER